MISTEFRSISWTTMKLFQQNAEVKLFYVTDNSDTNAYTIYATNYYFYFTCFVEGTGISDTGIDFVTNYKDNHGVQVTSGNEFLAISTPPISSQYVQKVEVASRVGSKEFNQFTIATPNFCRKTTWYQDYAQQTDVSCTPDGTFTIYSSSVADWINPDDFGLIAQEYNSGPPYYQLVGFWNKDGTLSAKNEWRPVIKVNGTPVSSGYSIDYSTGIITFSTPLLGTDVVTATFRTVSSISFLLRPTPGKMLSIPHVEINTTLDMDPQTVVFEVYGGDPTYSFAADVYCGYRMRYTGNKALYGLSTVGMDTYQPFGSTTLLPASAETGWSTNQRRGMVNPLIEIPYDFGGPGKFGKSIILLSSAYHVMRVKLDTNNELPGEYCSITFYTEEDVEPDP